MGHVFYIINSRSFCDKIFLFSFWLYGGGKPDLRVEFSLSVLVQSQDAYV